MIKIIKKEKSKIPAPQAIIYVLVGARTALAFLKELESQWVTRRENKRDGSLIREKQRVVLDALVTYVSSLFDTRPKTHSLLNSFEKHEFIAEFKSHFVVKKSILHRNNRMGHQSLHYGFIVPLQEVLSSDLDIWLNEAYYLVSQRQFELK